MNSKLLKKVKVARCKISIKDYFIIYFNKNFSLLTGYDIHDYENDKLKFNDIFNADDSFLAKLCADKKEKFEETFKLKLKRKDNVELDVICCAKYTESIIELIVMESDHLYSNILDLINSIDKINYESLLENIPCGIVICDIAQNPFHLIYATKKFYDIIGYSPEEYELATNGGYIDQLFSDEERERVLKIIYASIKDKIEFSVRTEMLKSDKSEIFVQINGAVYVTPDGTKKLQLAYTDITENQVRENIIRLQNEKYKILEETTEEFFFDYNVADDIFTLPVKCIDIFGRNVFHGYLKNDLARNFIQKSDYWKYITFLRSASISPQKNYIDIRINAFTGDMQWYRIHYVSLPNISGKISHIYGRIKNIENEKKWMQNNKESEEAIKRLSSTDYVTGLLNRHSFNEKANKIISKYNGIDSLAIVYSDINNFSYINENFGYDAGDNMLFDFSSSLNKLDNMMIGSRINSDFFAYIINNPDRETVISSVDRCNGNFINLQKQKYPECEIGVSTGIYFITDNTIDATVAMDNANLARRHIKRDNNSSICIYDEQLRMARKQEQKIISQLRTAIDEGFIEMFLQPKFSITTRQVIGAEALSRWRNVDGSYKFPTEFIGILEKTGYIGELDFYIYELALRLIRKWLDEGYEPIPISVNFSRINNSDTCFTEKIISLAEKYNVDRKYIELEITESAFTENSKSLLLNMKHLRERGFKVDIDDFGIGYSSLSLLLDAPIDVVKVDKYFVDSIDNSSLHKEYLRQMCLLINTTKKEIIFEGVETEDQAEFLNACGFDSAQGWLFDKAICVDEFENKYLKKKICC